MFLEDFFVIQGSWRCIELPINTIVSDVSQMIAVDSLSSLFGNICFLHALDVVEMLTSSAFESPLLLRVLSLPFLSPCKLTFPGKH